ncbi:PAS domain S-box protein [Pseudooceanicola sp. LIPI14-2-Ac024]|uniref:sensor histidine kinase n=1 Tax=Pseudooceanicola sp. LIPI14-2-Ac024 TaxID=3344875 RepID=UPI0035D04A27
MLTGEGDHLTFGTPGTPGVLAFHEDPGWTPSPFAPAVADGAGIDGIEGVAGQSFRAAQIIDADGAQPVRITLVTATDTAALQAVALAAAQRTALIALLLVIAAALGAAVAADRLPLGQLVAAIRDPSPEALDQVAQSGGEFSEIAQSYHLMSQTVHARTLHLQALYDSVPDGIMTINGAGRIQGVNPAVTTLFGYTPEELVDMPVELLMPDDIAPRHGHFVEAATHVPGSRPMAANRDIFGLCKDGTPIPLEISVTRVEHAGDIYFVGIIRDISDRKAAEARITAMVAALERSNEELDTFAYVASHDLKAPLRVIDNTSQWLEEDLEDLLTDDTRETLQMMRSRVRRMEKMLDDLLNHSRIGRDVQRAEPITGRELLATLRELVNLPRGWCWTCPTASWPSR